MRVAKDHSLGSSFQGVAASVAAAGFLSKVQIYNPALSGLRVLIRRIHVTADSTQISRLYPRDTTLASALTLGTNKRLGGAVATAQFWTQNIEAAAQSGQFAAKYVGTGSVFAFWDFGDLPIELAEGKGLVVHLDVVNVGLRAEFEWIERIGGA